VVTSREALVLYKCSAEYNRRCERGVLWNDPALAVRWPIADPVVSEKDHRLPLLADRAEEPLL